MNANAANVEIAGPEGRHDNRSLLRHATRSAHDRAEQRWSDVPGNAHEMATFLNAMLSLHLEFGLTAARSVDPHGALELEHERLAALRVDLEVAPPTEPAPASATRMHHHTAWGTLYALNGSALGATVLMRQSPETIGASTRYLELMSGFVRSGALGTFFRALNRQKLDMHRAASGATAVFAAMAEQAPGAPGAPAGTG